MNLNDYNLEGVDEEYLKKCTSEELLDVTKRMVAALKEARKELARREAAEK